jgi:hypothetical protein
MQPFKLAVLVLVAALASVCSNPARPSETVSELAISGADTALTGLPTSYTAHVTFADGTTRTATATWTSNNTQVAVVDDAGRLEARAHGSVVLTASFLSRQASKTVQVVNNYAGSWSGQYVVRVCDKSGQHDRDGGCRGIVGSESEVRLRLTQTGGTMREIGGTLDLGGVAFGVAIRGVVTADGRLNLDGRFDLPDFYGYGVCCSLEIGGWDTRLSGLDAMMGRWTQRFTYLPWTGHSYMESEIVSMTRAPTQSVH